MEQEAFFYEGKNFTFRWNPQENLCFMVIKGTQAKDDANEFESKVIDVFKKSPDSYTALKNANVLVDCLRMIKVEHEARKIYTKLATEFSNSRLAVFGTKVLARVIIGFILTASRRKNIKFFETKKQALSWLRILVFS